MGTLQTFTRSVSSHEFTLVSQVQSFYDGLTGLTQAIVDNACGGAMRELTAEEVLAKYEMLG